jgi:SAM-dependent methyltransferase
MSTGLEATGERVIEDAYRESLGGYVIYLMHIASYQFARTYCAGRRVLDLGCGSGYGAASLIDIADSVTAVDVSAEAVAFASGRYRAANLSFQKIDEESPLPFHDMQFDVVLSFQVIEHVVDDAAYLREARRVLKTGGVMIIVTPNRGVRLLPFQKPWNRWHVREYAMASLQRVVAPWLEIRKAHYMGAEDKVANVEIKRYRMVKWAMLPLTLPFIPEAMRCRGLDAVHAMRAKKSGQSTRTIAAPSFDFDASVMQIGLAVPNPLNLVLVVERQGEDDAPGP